MNRSFRRLVLVWAFLALLGCDERQAPVARIEKLTIAEASQPVLVLLYVADAKGYLKDAGLDVTFQSFTLGRDALASVLEGKADLATVFETPVVTKIYEGKDLAIVSTLHTSSRSQTIIARRDRGIRMPADLAGKRVGVSRGSTEFFLASFLATEAVPADKVTPVDLAPSEYEQALFGGRVDALAAFNPYQFDLRRKLGDAAVVFYNSAFLEASMLVGERSRVAQKSEATRRLLTAIVRAQAFAEANREESIRITVARLAGRFAEPVIRDGWPDFRAEAKLDHTVVSSMELQAKWLKDSGRVKGALPDIRHAMAPEYLRQVRPHAVTLPINPM